MNDPFGFNNNINSMLNNFFQDPFAPPRNNRNQNNNSRSNQLSLRNQFDPFSAFDHHNSLMASHQQMMNNNPFSLMNQMMGSGFGNSFNMMNQLGNDPNAQVFSSSTVMTYSNNGDGAPKIYQASSQVRQAPGGVKETRQMVRDSEKGLEKVAVGHHIGDRAHVIERKKFNGGDVEEIVNLENLDDGEVSEFNKEFESKIASQMRTTHHHRPHLGGNQPFAIEDGRKKSDRKSKSKSKH